MNYTPKARYFTGRFYTLLVVLGLIGLLITYRMISLTIHKQEFLRGQGNARSIRVVSLPAYRGMILDRKGVPLAVSTEVKSIWLNPKEFDADDASVILLAQFLKMKESSILQLYKRYNHKEFVYLKRGVPPDVAQIIKKLKIKGIYQKTEYKRFYPEGETSAHVVGITDIDDTGLEGIELSFNQYLHGVPGKRRVLKDRQGRVVDELEIIKSPKPGRSLYLSIDRRIQYLAYKALGEALDKHQGQSAQVVVLDVKTGELLAMVNVPSFNPNRRPKYKDGRYRNRVVTDVFEPGSVMKPFAIGAGLISGVITLDSIIDTTPGRIRLGGHIISDPQNLGKIDIRMLLKKSSNVGIAKITTMLPEDALWGFLDSAGFSHKTDIGFPGEREGTLAHPSKYRVHTIATLGFGYSLGTTALQVARAFSIFASGGKLKAISLIKRDNSKHDKIVMSPQMANTMLSLLEGLIDGKGSLSKAKVRGYRVAGKTGTSRILEATGYAKDRHIGSFVGIAPVSNPRLIVAVFLHDPKKGGYYGNVVAAPVFATVMAGALKILNIPPDKAENITYNKVQA